MRTSTCRPWASPARRARAAPTRQPGPLEARASGQSPCARQAGESRRRASKSAPIIVAAVAPAESTVAETAAGAGPRAVLAPASPAGAIVPEAIRKGETAARGLDRAKPAASRTEGRARTLFSSSVAAVEAAAAGSAGAGATKDPAGAPEATRSEP